MEIVLIRHSITASNLKNRYNGATDDPLCREGIALARESGCFPDVDRVFVTPLRRTQETAAILFPRAAQTVVPGLREMDFGDFENRSADEMADDPAYRAWVDGGCTAPCPRGEQMSGFCDRCERAFAELVRAERDAGRLVFVIHGGSIRAVLHGFYEQRRPFYDWYAKNCRGFRASLDWDGDRPVLRACTPLETLNELEAPAHG